MSAHSERITAAQAPFAFNPYHYFNPYYYHAKRVLDIMLSLILLCALGIVMLLIVAAIRLDSPGPVIFRQKRVGCGGVEFELYKFRSMYTNCDDGVHREAYRRYMSGEHLDRTAGTDMPYKLADDPRVTRVGRFIRQSSIDELPQLFNVLTGSMSLVGPRPPLPYEVEDYSGRDLLRLEGKPGVTGPWQVYGRGRVTFPEMVEMDIDYLQQWSLWLDLKLVFLTVPVVLTGRGGV
jgi:lipopolysaccharide/colanic/teichoic acid biosynthesis glycosyltransferase